MAASLHATVDASSLAPPPPPGMLRAIGLALLAHAVLIAALTWGVDWKQQDSPAIEAEIWSSATQQAAPRAVEPPVARPEPTPPPPVPQPAPPPPPQPQPRAQAAPPPPDTALRDVQIALEREKQRRELRKVRDQEQVEREEREERRRKVVADKKRQDELQKDKQAQTRREADAQALARRKATDQADARRKAESDQAVAAKGLQEQREAEAQRRTNLQRMAGMAGASGAPTATGTALQSTGPSASYGAKVSARVRPNIVFPDDIAGNPSADVEVRCAPDGTIVSRKLVKSSGVKSWDDAVLRAIDKTETLPRDTDGRVPAVLTIGFKPKDS